MSSTRKAASQNRSVPQDPASKNAEGIYALISENHYENLYRIRMKPWVDILEMILDWRDDNNSISDFWEALRDQVELMEKPEYGQWLQSATNPFDFSIKGVTDYQDAINEENSSQTDHDDVETAVREAFRKSICRAQFPLTFDTTMADKAKPWSIRRDLTFFRQLRLKDARMGRVLILDANIIRSVNSAPVPINYQLFTRKTNEDPVVLPFGANTIAFTDEETGESNAITRALDMSLGCSVQSMPSQISIDTDVSQRSIDTLLRIVKQPNMPNNVVRLQQLLGKKTLRERVNSLQCLSLDRNQVKNLFYFNTVVLTVADEISHLLLSILNALRAKGVTIPVFQSNESTGIYHLPIYSLARIFWELRWYLAEIYEIKDGKEIGIVAWRSDKQQPLANINDAYKFVDPSTNAKIPYTFSAVLSFNYICMSDFRRGKKHGLLAGIAAEDTIEENTNEDEEDALAAHEVDPEY